MRKTLARRFRGRSSIHFALHAHLGFRSRRDVRLCGGHGWTRFSHGLARLLRLGPVDLERLRGGCHRRTGLPITSSHIESTVKQINRRVKGSEKFWNSDGAESLLQLSADRLSETDPLTPFWRQRKFTTGQRRHQAAA